MYLASQILFVVLLLLGLYQILFSFNGLGKSLSVVWGNVKSDQMILYLWGFILIVVFSFSYLIYLHLDSFGRLISNFYIYLIQGDFYLGVSIGYDEKLIESLQNRILALMLGLSALFLPALFSLYTTFKKDIFESITDLKKNIPNLFCKIENDLLKKLELNRRIEAGLRIWHFIFLIVLILIWLGIISINTISNINVKGDLTFILLALTYWILVGYASLLILYSRTVLPIYQKVYRWENL